MTSRTDSADWSAEMGRNTVRLGVWTTAWVVTMALANFGPDHLWSDSTPLTLAAIALNLAVGVGMIVANKRYLQGLDEMQRKIQLDAMALSLGVGLIIGMAYSNLGATGLIGHADIALLVFVMTGAYAAGIVMGLRKYR